MEHRFTPTSMLLVGGLLVWMAAFTFLYVFAAVACAKGFADVQIVGLPMIPSVSIATSIIAAAANVKLVMYGWRSRKQRTLDAHSSFIGFVTLATSGLGLVALVLLVLPPLLVQACARA
jgi:hypothetical protein